MPTRVYIPTEPYTPTGESMYAQPAPDNALTAPPEQSALSRSINRLLGTQFGEERYQTWPEKMVRSAATLAGDVISGAVPVLPPGSRREDVTDEPAPGVDSSAPWWKMSAWVPPVAAQPNDVMMERAQDLAGVAMGGGIGGTGKAAAAGEAVLGSGPVRQVMRNSDMPVATAREQQLLRKAVREEEFKPFDQYPRQEVPIKELLATQEEVAPAIVQKKLQEEAHKGDNDVFIVKHDGKYYVEDGHHTITAAAQAGQPTIKAYVQEIGGSTPVAEAAGGKTLRSGMGDEGAGPVPINQNAPAWYSAVEHALEQSTTGAAPGAQWLATLRNSRGVKPEEMAWLGLDDYLAAAQVEGRKVTRAELQDYVRSHAVELNDVEKGVTRSYETMTPEEQAAARQRLQEFLGLDEQQFRREYPTPRDVSDGVNAMLRYFGDKKTGSSNTKYHDYQLPGGENYREHLITMPGNKDAWFEQLMQKRRDEGDVGLTAEERNYLRQGNYKSPHWDEPNILAHVRTNDRVIDGKKSLHLEEVQSDWHQQGRDKGYKDSRAEKKASDPNRDLTTAEADAARASRNAVPDAPFKKSWHELALKRMLRRAAEEGYERLSWTPGDAQAARYDLSKTIDKLFFMHNSDGTFDLRAQPKGGFTMELGKSVPADKLPDMVGKEMAKKLVEQEKGKGGNFSGLDLKVGGEGMKGFYDNIIPKSIEKLGKEFGVKVQKLEKSLPKFAVYQRINKISPDFENAAEARAWGKEHGFEGKATVRESVEGNPHSLYYIDIPQSLRDAALRKGFPLFSGGKMFVPHQEEDK